MALRKEDKAKVVQDFKINALDTGSAQVQIALLTERVNSLTVHLNKNKKDFSSKSGLLDLLGQRRKLLRYLENTNAAQYKDIIARLGLKK
jgi:small subunit ribosomal protein S15